MDLESYLDDPGYLLTNLDPPLASQKVLSSEIITVFQSANVQYRYHCRTVTSSSSWAKLGGTSYMHSVMAISGPSRGSAELT